MKRWAVLVGEELFSDSLCKTLAGALSYLGDAKHCCGAENVRNVRVVEMTIKNVSQKLIDEEMAKD